MTITLKKQFGQNFLTSRDAAKTLIDAAELDYSDLVVEVGGGAGMVTQYLAEVVEKVIVIEIDKRFVTMLRNRFLDHDNVTVHDGDVLQFNLSKYHLKDNAYKLVGSLPYNISKKIVQKFLEHDARPSTMTFLIQKEVAEDYAASPPRGTFLSNYIQGYGGTCEYVATIPKDVFNPIPKVDGGIIHISISNPALDNPRKFAKFLKAAFLNPRKKLVNNLRSIYRVETAELHELFSKNSIPQNARASELQFQQWVRIYQEIVNQPQ